MTWRRLLAAAVLATYPVAGSAEVRPTPGTVDPRIQTVLYDPEQVVQLEVASGYQLTIEFAPDERIENVAIGDSGAWQVTPNKRGDHLFIKASQNSTATDMTVVTDTRTYVFALTSSGGGGGPAFTVRFQYPPAKGAVALAANPVPAGRYRLGGTRALRPSAIDDDGTHTFIEWKPGQALPAIFTLSEQGEEALVNGAVRDGRFVLDSVSDHLVFRIDRRAAYASRRPRLPKR